MATNNWFEASYTNHQQALYARGDQHETLGYYKRGEWHFGVNTTNRTGDSPIVDTFQKHPVYDRSDVILYIGDHNVVGTGAISDLPNFNGYSVATLDQEIPDQLFNNYANNQTFDVLTGGDNFGAEISFWITCKGVKTPPHW